VTMTARHLPPPAKRGEGRGGGIAGGRSIGALALVLVLGSNAWAGDLDQARELAAKGKLDEAEKLLDDAALRLQGKEARNARRARAEITARRPMRASFEKARDLYLALAKEDENDVESRWALYELLWTRGERLVAAAPRSPEPEPLREEARQTWKEGADFLAEEWKALDAKGTDSADEALVACGFFRPRCLASLGRLDHRKKLLEEAVQLWADYGTRYGRRAEGFESAIDMAEALTELGRRDEALGAIEAGLAVEDCVDENGKLAEAAFEIFERASLVKGRLIAKDPKGALATFDKAIALAKKSAIADEATTAGKLVRVERAQALAQLGKQAEAVRELERMIALDPRGPAGELARQRLAVIAGHQEVTAKRALEDMNEALDRGQHALAIAHARSARLAARREQSKRDEALALEGLGRALEGERRVLEAAIAYEEAATPRAALGFVRCAETVRSRDPGPFANTLCERALALLSRDPAAKRGLAPFLLAKQLQEAGRYAEAATRYDEVAPDAGEIHDEALYGSACCRFADAAGKKESLEAVESRLRDLLARKATHANARLLLAETLLQLGRPAEVELVVPGDSTPEIQYRAIALARTGKDSEPLVATLLERKALDHRTAVACHELVAAADAARRPALARYYEVWLDDASPRDISEIARSTFLAAMPVLGLPEKGGFLVELDGDPAQEAKPILTVSARAWEKLAKTATRERWKVLAARAEALALSGEWEPAAKVFAFLLAETKLLADTGHVEGAVASKEPLLLGYLADMGVCELRSGAREKGEAHLAAVVEAVREATPLWWQVRLALLRDLDRRGTAEALKEAKLVLRTLERKYPGFEAAKGLASKFFELKKKLD